MIQLKTQTSDYWGVEFSLSETDIDTISNHLLEVSVPQTIQQLAQIIIQQRVSEEKQTLRRTLEGCKIYQPKRQFVVGDEVVFPALKFARAEVTAVRPGYNPEHGNFQVFAVHLRGKDREFSAELDIEHPLNQFEDPKLTDLIQVDIDALVAEYGEIVSHKLTPFLEKREDFVRLGRQWFLKPLMIEINVGHLHLAEAILEMHEGGPLPPEEIAVHLDFDPSIQQEVQIFSLNYGLLQDNRFDEVAPKDHILWFLHRLEPDEVKTPPPRLAYTPEEYDRTLLTQALVMLEREIGDEWSKLPPNEINDLIGLNIIFPHRVSGTLPLSARTEPFFPPSHSPRQRVILVDDYDGEEIQAWVVREGRYVYGLADWFEKVQMPIGGYIYLKQADDPQKVIISYDKRQPRKEWVQLATVQDNQLRFNLEARAIPCGYDDLLIVGTDVLAAVEALWKKHQSYSIPRLLAEVFPSLAEGYPQQNVHAKTLYSAVNMLKRVPPGLLFATMMEHPAFQKVGDDYWYFEPSRIKS